MATIEAADVETADRAEQVEQLPTCAGCGTRFVTERGPRWRVLYCPLCPVLADDLAWVTRAR